MDEGEVEDVSKRFVEGVRAFWALGGEEVRALLCEVGVNDGDDREGVVDVNGKEGAVVDVRGWC